MTNITVNYRTHHHITKNKCSHTYHGVTFLEGDIESDTVCFYHMYSSGHHKEIVRAKRIKGSNEFYYHHDSEPSKIIETFDDDKFTTYRFFVDGVPYHVEDLPCDDIDKTVLVLRYTLCDGMFVYV